MIPLTRPITILIHEPIFPLLREIAEEKHDGNVSDYIRLMLYTELITQGKLRPELLKEIG